MRFKNDFLLNYLCKAPIPLAVERWHECKILQKQEFQRPILDLGCGDGIFASVLFDENIDVGIEPDKLEIENSRKQGMYQELITCYGDKIPKEDGYFNTIFSNSVLEHIPDLDGIVREIHRLLSDTGNLYISVPTNLFDKYSVIYQILIFLGLSSPAERYRLFFNRFWKHYHYYEKDAWVSFFEERGFKIIYSQEYCSKSVTLFNDFMAPFSIFSFISKKLFNRWILFPPIRKITAYFAYTAIRPFLKINPNQKDGGILFLALKKS